MKIICDFDRTVFDTERLYRILEKEGLSDKSGTMQSLEVVDPPNLIFPDAAEYFRTHTQHQFFIVSSVSGKTADWDIEYQKEKIKQSEVSGLVSKVCVVSGEKASVINKLVGDEEALFIDDLEKHLEDVTLSNPNIIGVLINRVESANPSRFPQIHSFSEVDGIIDKI